MVSAAPKVGEDEVESGRTDPTPGLRPDLPGRVTGLARPSDPLKGEGNRFVEARWPPAEFIVGNPPFLGGKLLRGGLGDAYVETLFQVYEGRVPREADLVTYWFDKARAEIAVGGAKAAGLVSTNSIRGGANRKVLERVMADATLFEAWLDEPWVVDGAAVRVSLVCFGRILPSPLEGEGGETRSGETDEGSSSSGNTPHPSPSATPSPSRGEGRGHGPLRLNGVPVAAIFSDLSASGSDLTTAPVLPENRHIAFQGIVKVGAFDIPGARARSWLREPLNPNGRPNSDVIRNWSNGSDIVRSKSDTWIIDFSEMSQGAASLYQAPFEFVVENIKPIRTSNRDQQRREKWWRLGRSGSDVKSAIGALERCIVTPRVAKHRIFVWESKFLTPDSAIIAIARDDDTSFGILHSRFHEAWSLRLGTWLGVGNDPRYTPTTTFETFPFPEGLTPDIPAQNYAADPRAVRIAAAAQELDAKRRAWLNPPDLVDIVPEITPTAAPGEEPVRYPNRMLPKNAEAALKLKERTLTNLYNQRPQWLASLHEALDHAVAAAYGWPEDISTDDALARLLALNLERSAVSSGPGSPSPRRIGFMAGQIEVPDDFNTTGQEAIDRMFDGE